MGGGGRSGGGHSPGGMGGMGSRSGGGHSPGGMGGMGGRPGGMGGRPGGMGGPPPGGMGPRPPRRGWFGGWGMPGWGFWRRPGWGCGGGCLTGLVCLIVVIVIIVACVVGGVGRFFGNLFGGSSNVDNSSPGTVNESTVNDGSNSSNSGNGSSDSNAGSSGSGSNGSSSGSSTGSSSRTRIDTGVAFSSDCILDEIGAVEDLSGTGESLEEFYELTGVQPYIYLKAYDSSLTTNSAMEDYAFDWYDNNIDNEGTFLFVYFAPEDNDADSGYMVYVDGYDIEDVMDADAVETFWHYVDSYWYTDDSVDERLVQIFTDTATEIMH